MDPARIAALLEPYLAGPLSSSQLTQVSTYLDLLLRWNARTNLTSIRDPEAIITRHFGESFFLSQKCVTAGALTCPAPTCVTFDLGSGAGFPAIPLKIADPTLNLTLVEAHHTKAVFLREVLRALDLHAEVKNVRAETLPAAIADLVTFRAVERFEAILLIAARLLRVNQSSRLALLISANQVDQCRETLKNWHFHPLIPIPGSQKRLIQFAEPN